MPEVRIPVVEAVFKSFSKMLNSFRGLDNNQLAMFIVCLAFLLVVIAPVVTILSVLLHYSYWIANSPGTAAKIFITSIAGSNNDVTLVTTFITPIFALLAGLKSRTSGQSLFFTTFVCLSLFGAVGSLLAKYFVASDEAKTIFTNPAWIGEGAPWDTWRTQSEAFFGTSFQTFLGFISVLLGLRAATSN